MGSERKFGWHGLQPNPDVLALPRVADWPPWHQCLSRNGSEAKGRLPGGGRCARPGGGCPIPCSPRVRGSRARAPRACAQGCGPLPQGARTAKLDLGAALGHRPRKPASDAEQRARQRLPESAAELSPVADRATGLALLPAPMARRRGLPGVGGDAQPQAAGACWRRQARLGAARMHPAGSDLRLGR